MEIKQDMAAWRDYNIEACKSHIEHLEKELETWRFHLKVWQEMPVPPTAQQFQVNAPLTRDLVRKLFSLTRRPMQTVEMIDYLYPMSEADKKSKLVKTLSVILNQMEKENEIKIEKKKGVKGNFYTFIEDTK